MSDETSLEYQCALLHMRRALRPYRRANAFFVVVVLPADTDESFWKAAAKTCLSEIVKTVETAEDDGYRDFRRATRGANSVDFFELTNGKGKRSNDPMSGLLFGDIRTVGLVRRHEAKETLSYASLSIADAVIDIAAVDPLLVQRAAKLSLDAEISAEDADDIIAMPASLRECLRRTGRPLGQVLANLRAARVANATEPKQSVPRKADGTPRLEDLHGYGTAKEWGLELVRDLADFSEGRLSWDDVDGGLLLSGPPGTGKTTFARALAESCEVRLFVGSYSTWQAHGHQGDMLRAMKRTFDAARDNAPSILLIDEIDNFSDRERDTSSADYLRGCVNGLLEQLDGAVDRTGVVVIGACNHPDKLDPALRRPGRLDRHIQLTLPDAAARREILRYHLQADVEVDAVLERTDGCSGAELERIARDARRVARRARIPVATAHVVAAMPELTPRTPEQVRLISLHELGHAIVSVVTGVEIVDEVVATKFYESASEVGIGGYTKYAADIRMVRSRAYYADKLASLLGGLAAEEVILGSHSDGVRSDLMMATRLATFALGTVGMGDTLISDGALEPAELANTRYRSYDLERRVDKLLREMRERAVGICRDYREVIEELSCRLEDFGRLDGDEVVAAVRAFQRPQPAQLSLAFG